MAGVERFDSCSLRLAKSYRDPFRFRIFGDNLANADCSNLSLIITTDTSTAAVSAVRDGGTHVIQKIVVGEGYRRSRVVEDIVHFMTDGLADGIYFEIFCDISANDLAGFCNLVRILGGIPITSKDPAYAEHAEYYLWENFDTTYDADKLARVKGYGAKILATGSNSYFSYLFARMYDCYAWDCGSDPSFSGSPFGFRITSNLIDHVDLSGCSADINTTTGTYSMSNNWYQTDGVKYMPNGYFRSGDIFFSNNVNSVSVRLEGSVPTGTRVVLYARQCATIDGDYGRWFSTENYSLTISQSTRKIQYAVALYSTNGSATPVITNVIVS